MKMPASASTRFSLDLARCLSDIMHTTRWSHEEWIALQARLRDLGLPVDELTLGMLVRVAATAQEGRA
ncbi:hypothetical protein [Stenotrophomonas sp. B1-1]|uniref:hypothetical protein n=1 Tax=Stenotrophomonas sp. B1-1 TaxID=2710648 RepID=UPI0013DA71D0|nr:hypothetical protein [Stenotrophomonas sp. B1-1]